MPKETTKHEEYDDGLAKTVVSGIAGSPSLARLTRAIYAQQTQELGRRKKRCRDIY